MKDAETTEEIAIEPISPSIAIEIEEIMASSPLVLFAKQRNGDRFLAKIERYLTLHPRDNHPYKEAAIEAINLKQYKLAAFFYRHCTDQEKNFIDSRGYTTTLLLNMQLEDAFAFLDQETSPKSLYEFLDHIITRSDFNESSMHKDKPYLLLKKLTPYTMPYGHIINTISFKCYQLAEFLIIQHSEVTIDPLTYLDFARASKLFTESKQKQVLFFLCKGDFNYNEHYTIFEHIISTNDLDFIDQAINHMILHWHLKGRLITKIEVLTHILTAALHLDHLLVIELFISNEIPLIPSIKTKYLNDQITSQYYFEKETRASLAEAMNERIAISGLFLYLSCGGSNKAITNLLIKHTPPQWINHHPQNIESPLFYLVANDLSQSIHLFVVHGGKLNVKNRDENSALYFAFITENTDALIALAECKAPLQNNEHAAIAKALFKEYRTHEPSLHYIIAKRMLVSEHYPVVQTYYKALWQRLKTTRTENEHIETERSAGLSR